MYILPQPQWCCPKAPGKGSLAVHSQPCTHLLGREAVLLVQLRCKRHQLLLCEVPDRLPQHLVCLGQLRALVHGVQPAAPQGQRWKRGGDSAPPLPFTSAQGRTPAREGL